MAVSFATDIKAMFTQDDIDHMQPFEVLLDDYGWMSDPAGGKVGKSTPYPDHAHARAVYCYLTGECKPRMPQGGPFWSDGQLAKYKQWMDDGFPP